MVIPNNIFIFYLTNWEGKAYFLDSSGNIQLGNVASGIDYSLQDGPANWMDIELSFAQNQHYYGMVRSFSTDLKFVKSSATIIRKLLYEGRGVEQQIYFIATKWSPSTGIYELEYKGELDFSQISEDDPIIGITVKCLEGGVSKLIKSYENTFFEIPCDGSISENKSVFINGLMFEAIFNFEISPINFADSGNVLPIIFTTQQGNDVGIIKSSQKFKAFTADNTGDISTIKASGNYFFSSAKPILTSNLQGGVNISGSITFGGSMDNGRLFIMFTDSTANIDLIPLTSIGSEVKIFSVDLNVPAGTGLFLCFYCFGNHSSSIITGGMAVKFKSQFEDTYVNAISPGDMFRLIMKNIFNTATQNQSINPLSQTNNNISYPISATLLDSYANLVLTSGSAIRNNDKAVIKISLSEFFDIYNVELMASMGKEETDEGEQIYFEHREADYNSDVLDIDLGEVARLKIQPANDLYFDILKIGYPEQKYDNKQGNDEVNTIAQYRTPYKKEQRELNLVSKARGDAFGVEYTRFLVGTTNTSNNKSDNDPFLINIDLDSTQSIGVTIDSVLSQSLPSYINYQNRILQDSARTFLNWPIQFNSIQGTSFKNNFQIVDGNFTPFTDTQVINYKNTKIAWINTQAGFTTINGNVNIEGVINDIITIKHIFNTPFFYSLADGQFRFKFTIYQNGIDKGNQIVNVILGDLFHLTIPFTMDLYFGDQIYIDWQLIYDFESNGLYYIKISGVNTEILPATVQGTFNKVNLLITSNDQIIYNLKRIVYNQSSYDGITDIRWSYNIEQMTPSRLIERHGNWLRSVFYNLVNDSFKFLMSDKNHSLSTTKDGIQYTEGTDILISSMNNNILFYPYYLTFDTEIPITFNELIRKIKRAHIHFTFYGIDFFGFAVEVKHKPALNPAQSWKLLASPKNDLANFSKLDVSGFKLLNLQKMGAFISHLNPIKWYPANPSIDARYNMRSIDEDFFINQSAFYAQTKNYYAKWQTNDIIPLQFYSNTLAPVIVTIYDSNKILIDTILTTQKTDNAVQSPFLLFETTINLSLYPEGIYYFIATYGITGNQTAFVSEGIWSKNNWPRTMLCEYSHSSNLQQMIFSDGFKPCKRIEAVLLKFVPKSHTTAFEDQPADMKILNSIPIRSWKLEIGQGDGLPPYEIDLMNRIMGLDSVTFDGLGISKYSEDSEFEEILATPGWSKNYWSIEVRPSFNEYGVFGAASGDIENPDDTYETYLVDTQYFGEKIGSTNIIPVKKIK
jgi:hypothetical protein